MDGSQLRAYILRVPPLALNAALELKAGLYRIQTSHYTTETQTIKTELETCT